MSESGLRRQLTLRDAYLVGVGSMVGSGIFLGASQEAARHLGSTSLVLLVWLAAGLLSLGGALICAELGTMFPRAGGLFVFLKEAYGPLTGFLYGWASITVIQTGAIAAIAVAFATYSRDFVAFPRTIIPFVASGIILLLTVINSRSVRLGAETQNIFTFAKVSALAVLFVAGLLWAGSASAEQATVPVDLTPPAGAVLILPFAVGLVGALWSYDGWICISYVAGEVKNPSRNLPLALAFSTATVVIIYLATNYIYLSTLTVAGVAETELVATATAARLMGPFGSKFVSLAILVSTFGTTGSFLLSCPRIYYGMAQEGVFFKSLARVHPAGNTPYVAIWVQGLLAMAFTFTGSYVDIFTNVIFMSWIAYALAAGAVLRLRYTRPDLARDFRVPGYPWLPLGFIAVAATFVVLMFIADAKSSLALLGLLAFGVPVFYLWRRWAV